MGTLERAIEIAAVAHLRAEIERYGMLKSKP